MGLVRPRYFPLRGGMIVLMLLLLASEAFCLPEETAISEMRLSSPKLTSLVKELTETHGFDISFLKPLFKEAVIRPEILEKFERAPEKKLQYYEYRKIFLTESLLAAGHLYFKTNQSLLGEVEAEYGVPKEIIAAILGIETRFGQPGIEPYRAWDIFNTLYLLYPPRAAFFKEELIAFLKLCQKEELDPLSIRSSYAGAMGTPQFMPSSFLKYAVDYDGDKKRNLWSSNGDIYASVANYLKEAGWKKDGPLFFPVTMTGTSTDFQKWTESGIREVRPVAEAVKIGVQMPVSVNPEAPVSFVTYKPEEGQNIFLSLFDNFRAITRYNISVNYALVVIELAEILAKGNEAPATSLPDAVLEIPDDKESPITAPPLSSPASP